MTRSLPQSHLTFQSAFLLLSLPARSKKVHLPIFVPVMSEAFLPISASFMDDIGM